jgi:V8-like Glu-specific endopeptidase
MAERRSSAALAISLALLAFAAPATAAGTSGSGIFGTDDREVLDGRKPPFDAVGRVNVGGFRSVRHCTGTLVAPKLVLTAAHCVVDPHSLQPVSLERLHFVAGINPGTTGAHSGVACVKFLDGYHDTPPNLQARGPEDAALLVLAGPMAARPMGLAAVAPPATGTRLLHASFPRDRPHALFTDRACRLVDARGSLWVTTCDTNFGSSGGPVLVEQGGEFRLAAIMIGFVAGRGSVALGRRRWQPLLDTPACP